MDPTPAQIEADFPWWRVSQGMDGFWYAFRDTMTPLRDENLTELRAQVASWERLHAGAERMPG